MNPGRPSPGRQRKEAPHLAPLAAGTRTACRDRPSGGDGPRQPDSCAGVRWRRMTLGSKATAGAASGATATGVAGGPVTGLRPVPPRAQPSRHRATALASPSSATVAVGKRPPRRRNDPAGPRVHGAVQAPAAPPRLECRSRLEQGIQPPPHLERARAARPRHLKATPETGLADMRTVVDHLVAVRPLYRQQHLGNEGFMALHCQVTFAWPTGSPAVPAGSPAVPAGGPELDWRAEWPLPAVPPPASSRRVPGSPRTEPGCPPRSCPPQRLRGGRVSRC
jgi:hypothetical protein